MVTSQLASLCKKGSVKIGLTTTTTTRMMMMMTTTTSMATGTPSGFWLNENPIRTPSAQWIQVAQRTSRTSPCPSESPWSISAFASKVQPHFAPCGLPQEGLWVGEKNIGLETGGKNGKKTYQILIKSNKRCLGQRWKLGPEIMRHQLMRQKCWGPPTTLDHLNSPETHRSKWWFLQLLITMDQSRGTDPTSRVLSSTRTSH